MALSKLRKKKLIIIIIIVSALVDALIDADNLNSPQERTLRLVGRAEWEMNEFPDDEGSWSTAQNDLAGLIDVIYMAHQPEVINPPEEEDYQQWEIDLATAIENL